MDIEKKMEREKMADDGIRKNEVENKFGQEGKRKRKRMVAKPVLMAGYSYRPEKSEKKKR